MKRNIPWLAFGAVIAAGGYLAMAQESRPGGSDRAGSTPGQFGPARSTSNGDARSPRSGSRPTNGSMPEPAMTSQYAPTVWAPPQIGATPSLSVQGLPPNTNYPVYVPQTSPYSNYSAVGNSYSLSTAGPSGPNTYRQELPIVEDGKFRILVLESAADETVRTQANEARKQVDDALQTIRSEDSDREDIDKAKKTLANYLDAQFEHDQEARRKQIESLEKQVSKLRKQMEKRNDSKSKLIELRLTLLENDNSGLSFPNAWNSMGGPQQPTTVYSTYPATAPLFPTANSFPMSIPPNFAPSSMQPIPPMPPNASYAPSASNGTAYRGPQPTSTNVRNNKGPGTTSDLPKSAFDRMDKDGDGGLDEIELEEVTKGSITFESADTNEDGKVDHEELVNARRRFTPNNPEKR